MTDRTYDVTLFGATGFTGRLAAEYLAGRSDAPRWAIAGRDRRKLEALADELGVDVGIVVASVDDPATLDAMCAGTRVLSTTVGPYDRYGEPVVEACVRARTDYVDITGEPQFVDRILERHDGPARDAGLRIVPCCGFDSVPHDLGVLLTVRALPRDVPLDVSGYVKASGSFSGGTWHSAVGAFSQLVDVQRSILSLRRRRRPEGRRVRVATPAVHRAPHGDGWACTMPTIDPEIVCLTARTRDEYGPDFRYGHYVRVKSLPSLVGGALGLGGIVALAQLPPTRRWLLSKRPPGDGPSPEERARGFFRVTFVGRGGGRQVETVVEGGDPGYGDTARMVVESALCLAFDRDRLGGLGVTTPADAMGRALVDRLQPAGITFTTEVA